MNTATEMLARLNELWPDQVKWSVSDYGRTVHVHMWHPTERYMDLVCLKRAEIPEGNDLGFPPQAGLDLMPAAEFDALIERWSQWRPPVSSGGAVR